MEPKRILRRLLPLWVWRMGEEESGLKKGLEKVEKSLDKVEKDLKEMERALEETIIEGVATTIPFHQAIFRDPNFRSGDIHIDFLKDFKFQ